MERSALGIDHGTKRTGFAVTDPLRLSVQPLGVCQQPGDSDELCDHVAGLLDDRDVDVFVVGQPLNMDGSAGPRAADVEAFCERLRQRFPAVTVVLVDERLTTKEAESRLSEAGYRGQERKARKDSWSAALLLEEWIRTGEPR
ncbi:MAG: Holliday junction resolvase RuvX [Planctomycetota bacterium]|nr:Holliday junction resolvase RuvX [Planctomycetota bacterium]